MTGRVARRRLKHINELGCHRHLVGCGGVVIKAELLAIGPVSPTAEVPTDTDRLLVVGMVTVKLLATSAPTPGAWLMKVCVIVTPVPLLTAVPPQLLVTTVSEGKVTTCVTVPELTGPLFRDCTV